MASFFGGKIARVAVMNTAFNLGLVPAVYKGKTVVPGNFFLPYKPSFWKHHPFKKGRVDFYPRPE